MPATQRQRLANNVSLSEDWPEWKALLFKAYNRTMKLHNSIDEYYMARCLELARYGEGCVSPNPMVGAVVLNSRGEKVGEGYHARAGHHHAEVMALQAAGDQARGGTLYVNLEPCNHTGKTPPCTRALIDAGIERVFWCATGF